MSDAIKIAIKTGLIAVVMATGLLILKAVTIPTLTLTPIITALGKGKALVSYYMGSTGMSLLTYAFILLTMRYVLLITIAISSIAYKWIFKVNE